MSYGMGSHFSKGNNGRGQGLSSSARGSNPTGNGTIGPLRNNNNHVGPVRTARAKSKRTRQELSEAGKSENERGSGTDASGTLSGISSFLQSNGYKMGRILGEGSYSKVRLCTRVQTGKNPVSRLACKIINKTKASDDFVTKFLPRELTITSQLDHPNIVRVFNIIDYDHHVYIFMDCCDKGDLLEYVKNRGQISENRSRHYFRQLLSAVRYLHSKDIAHRDLKCENVLLGCGDLVKISDFGFSRLCRDDEGRRILSKTYCGSAAYAAPEILQGTSYNPKLYDMWSLGCILFIMLTGHMPYDESNVQKMLQNQLARSLTYPGNVEEQLTEAARGLIRKLLEPDVTRRANVDHAVCHEWTNFPTRAPLSHDCYESGGDSNRKIGESCTPSASMSAVPMSYYGLPSRSEIFSKLIHGGPVNHVPSYPTSTMETSESPRSAKVNNPFSKTFAIIPSSSPRYQQHQHTDSAGSQTQRSVPGNSGETVEDPNKIGATTRSSKQQRISETARQNPTTTTTGISHGYGLRERAGGSARTYGVPTPRRSIFTGVTNLMNSFNNTIGSSSCARKGKGSPATTANPPASSSVITDGTTTNAGRILNKPQ